MCFSVFSSDVQQPLVIKEEVSPEWCPSLDQENPKPLHIKQEENHTQELNGLGDINRSSFTAVKIEDDEDETNLSLHGFIEGKPNTTARQSLQPAARQHR